MSRDWSMTRQYLLTLMNGWSNLKGHCRHAWRSGEANTGRLSRGCQTGLDSMLASVRRPSRCEAMESQRCRIHQQQRKPIGGLNKPFELLGINKHQGKHWCDDSINHHEIGPTKSLGKCRRCNILGKALQFG
ncbi:hypothetical protein J1N35_043325 [Gossypium stocksii]|uniref:Uncharacterized protein n=1 Tax=Gossypium stocksii TaxID=47602 RepID=A0A9D3U734_9ROSI|nr:hypothetical protein J1N35_043325 [Gossypium stocksii]